MVKSSVKPTVHVAPLDVSKTLIELGGSSKVSFRLQEVSEIQAQKPR